MAYLPVQEEHNAASSYLVRYRRNIVEDAQGMAVGGVAAGDAMSLRWMMTIALMSCCLHSWMMDEGWIMAVGLDDMA